MTTTQANGSLHLLTVLMLATAFSATARETNAQTKPLKGAFKWTTNSAVVQPRDIEGISCYSIKDPSVVRYKNHWHLFCTIRGKPRSHAIVYLTFADWKEADQAQRHVLPMHEGYCCAPQVFYFSPHKRWYLICQAASDQWDPKYQPAFATTTDISNPRMWSKLTPLYDKKPDNIKAWLDFWVICDERKAHLFFTSLNGKMWRSETRLKAFPRRWSKPVLALEGDVFEASHTYYLKEQSRYLTLIEAQGGHGWRYYKAYVGERLEGPWRPLAASKDQAFASMRNVDQMANRWTDSISHGELLRDGHDQRLEVDPARLRFLFQGVLDRQRRGKPYGSIPWRLGVLEPATNASR